MKAQKWTLVLACQNMGKLAIKSRHRLICGDCKSFGDVDRLLDGNKINVAVTSPPYASQREYDKSSGFKPIPPDDYVEWYADVAANIMAHISDDGSYFCNIKEHCEEGQRSLYVKDLTLAHVRSWGWMFVDELIWKKPGLPGGWENRFKNDFEPIFHYSKHGKIKFYPREVGHQSDNIRVYEHGKSKSDHGNITVEGALKSGIARPSNVIEVSGSDGNHPAAYPVALPEFFIKAFSETGDVIYDPFMGSGTTMIAAEKNGRRGFGCEISPKYCDLIVARYEAYSGQKAVLWEN